jgi:hypothetical protein
MLHPQWHYSHQVQLSVIVIGVCPFEVVHIHPDKGSADALCRQVEKKTQKKTLKITKR